MLLVGSLCLNDTIAYYVIPYYSRLYILCFAKPDRAPSPCYPGPGAAAGSCLQVLRAPRSRGPKDHMNMILYTILSYTIVYFTLLYYTILCYVVLCYIILEHGFWNPPVLGLEQSQTNQRHSQVVNCKPVVQWGYNMPSRSVMLEAGMLIVNRSHAGSELGY